MSHVVIIGCGIIGAAIAYELSLVPGLTIAVLDRHLPAQGATSAALGVLMGAISRKIKGNAWNVRFSSIQRYETLIPELTALTGRQIPCNRQGILMLCFQEQDLADWEKLVKIRADQGWQLEIWDIAKLHSFCPQLDCQKIAAAIYSPQDRQVDPVALTLALVDAAKRNGVTFHFGVTVADYDLNTASANKQLRLKVQPTSCSDRPLTQIDADWLIVAAGLGSTKLQLEKITNNFVTADDIPHLPYNCQGINELQQPVVIKPVLGQALQLELNSPLGRADFQPVITGDDVHIVPCNDGKTAAYWVGATVEFPTDNGDLTPVAERLEAVRQQAIAFCPGLASAKIVRTWSGLRPRPEGRAAPVIASLPGLSNVILATGHYRNGVLLAPATAQIVRQVVAGN